MVERTGLAAQPPCDLHALEDEIHHGGWCLFLLVGRFRCGWRAQKWMVCRTWTMHGGIVVDVPNEHRDMDVLRLGDDGHIRLHRWRVLQINVIQPPDCEDDPCLWRDVPGLRQLATTPQEVACA